MPTGLLDSTGIAQPYDIFVQLVTDGKGFTFSCSDVTFSVGADELQYTNANPGEYEIGADDTSFNNGSGIVNAGLWQGSCADDPSASFIALESTHLPTAGGELKIT